MKKARRNEARTRLFKIWQKTGIMPFHKDKSQEKKESSFFKGSFDNIPFLNEDAKRTFTHLLLRPGYMIRDYIHGKQDVYLAPMTSLLVFYAFFSLMCSIINPSLGKTGIVDFSTDDVEDVMENDDHIEGNSEGLIKALTFVKNVYILTHLDLNPDQVDTAAKASLASLEGNLRSQGVQEFLSTFFVLWFAIWMLTKRRYGFSPSAAATTSAYILCQYSFFRLFTLILTWGHSNSLGLMIIIALMAFDYHQMFGVNWKKSLRLTILTGIYMGLAYAIFFSLVGGSLYLFFFL